jgi:hypothetical protein
MDTGGEVIYSGVLRKKGGRVNVWSERFFVLKGGTLYYYVKSTDAVSCFSFAASIRFIIVFFWHFVGAERIIPTAPNHSSLINYNVRQQQKAETVYVQNNLEG